MRHEKCIMNFGRKPERTTPMGIFQNVMAEMVTSSEKVLTRFHWIRIEVYGEIVSIVTNIRVP
jgi:hypothetical protein